MKAVLLGVCLFILVWNVLVSAVRGVRKSLLRLLTALLAAVAAVVLSRLLCVRIAEWLLPQMQQLLGEHEVFAPFFNGEIAANEAIALLAEMLVAPLLFLLLYMLLKALLLILFAVLKLLTCFLRFLDKTAVSRLLGAATGVLIGLIGIVAFITPVLGYADLASTTVDVVVRSSEAADTVERTTIGEAATDKLLDAEALHAMNDEYLKPLLKTPVLSQLYYGVGSRLFERLTSEEWHGETVHLKSEIAMIADIAANVGVLGNGGVTSFDENESLAVSHIAQDVGASPLLSELFAGTVSAASGHWLAGERFFGIEKPDMGVNGNPLFDAFLQVFATANRQTVAEDLDFFADAFALFVEHELFGAFAAAEPNDDAVAVLLSDSGLFADVQLLIDDHPRMQPVARALVDFGMRVMLQEMGLPENIRESCGELLEDMSDVLQNAPTKEDGTLDAEGLTAGLSQAFDENGLSISEEAAHLVAEGIADHFTAEELETLSVDEVIDKLVERFGNVDISGLTDGTSDLP